MRFLCAILLGVTLSSPAFAEQFFWVITQETSVRTCNSSDCGVIKKAQYGQRLIAQETNEEWVRISSPMDAKCVNGESTVVIEGNKACNETNGIKNGQFSMWVGLYALSEVEQVPLNNNSSSLITPTDQVLNRTVDDFTRCRALYMLVADSYKTIKSVKSVELTKEYSDKAAKTLDIALKFGERIGYDETELNQKTLNEIQKTLTVFKPDSVSITGDLILCEGYLKEPNSALKVELKAANLPENAIKGLGEEN